MKIILCLHHFLPEYVGGTEIYTFNLAKQLIQKNIDVLIVVPNLGEDTTTEYLYEGIKVIKYAENSIEDRSMILGKKKPDGLEVFADIIKSECPSLVHFHELAPGRGFNIFHVEKVYDLRIPLVITFHVPFYTCFKGSLIYKEDTACDGTIEIEKCTTCIYHQKGIKGLKASLFTKAAMGLFNLNINTTRLNNSVGTALGFPFVINKIKSDLLRLSFFAERIVVIADWYKQVLERNKIPAEKITFIKQGLTGQKHETMTPLEVALPIRVVYMGRITHLKGFHLLIDAILKLPSSKISLDIYGLETEDEYVVSCKGKTKHARNIAWKGRVDTSKVIPVLSTYHLLCVPSAFEMSPLVIQEAFAAGIPVLASDVPGNVEQIEDGENGWLFKSNNSADLKSKLEGFIADKTLIENAKKKLPELNTFKEVGNDHEALYHSIVENYKRN